MYLEQITQPKVDEKDFLFHKIKGYVDLAGVLKEAQIQHMFRDYGEISVSHMIKELARRNEINYDKNKGELHSRMVQAGRTKLTQSIITSSFWLPAYVGENAILDLSLGCKPTQFLWLSGDEEGEQNLFDATTLLHGSLHSTAMLWEQKNKALYNPELDYLITHIAIVADEQDGKEAETFGFDCFCILGQDGKPVYHNYE